MFIGLPLHLLYLGPETVVPVTSALGAALGFLLIFGRSIMKGVRRFWPFKSRKESPTE
ncbi:MAG TPA: hypothetical protein VGM23_14080 [Armatimonadota bacterium]